MVTETIRKFTREIEQNDYKLPDDQYNAVTTLMNLYTHLADAQPEDKPLLASTLEQVKKALSPNKIKQIWDCPSTRVDLRDELLRLKTLMITDIFYIATLDKERIIHSTGNEQWLRLTMIALIRQHLLMTNHTDPFADFKYSLLDNMSNDGSHTTLEPIFKSCHSIPTDDLVRLAGNKIEAKRQIMGDLYGSKHYFSLSSRYVSENDLRGEIAERWKKFFQHNVLDKKTKKAVSSKLKSYAQQYPEFRNIRIDTAVSRYVGSIPTTAAPKGMEAVTASSRLMSFVSSLKSMCSSTFSGMSSVFPSASSVRFVKNKSDYPEVVPAHAATPVVAVGKTPVRP